MRHRLGLPSMAKNMWQAVRGVPYSPSLFRNSHDSRSIESARSLRESWKKLVDSTEQIARLVPKRNVETWILCLNEQAVDEEIDYKRTRHDWNELIPPAAEGLWQWARSNDELPNFCVDSLRNGIRELRRLKC